MMVSAFPTTAIAWWALDIDTSTLETYIMKRTKVGVPPTKLATLDKPYMGVWCYRTLVDGFCLLVAGRGYTTTTRASLGDEDLICLSTNNGGTWIEKGAALYDDYGVTGIVGAFADHSED